MHLVVAPLLGLLCAAPTNRPARPTEAAHDHVERRPGTGLAIAAGTLGALGVAGSVVAIRFRQDDEHWALDDHYDSSSSWLSGSLGVPSLTLPTVIVSTTLTLGATGLAVRAGVRGGRGQTTSKRRRTAFIASGAALAGVGTAAYLASILAPMQADCSSEPDLEGAQACNRRAFLPAYPLAGIGAASAITGAGLLAYGVALRSGSSTVPTLSMGSGGFSLGVVGRF